MKEMGVRFWHAKGKGRLGSNAEKEGSEYRGTNKNKNAKKCSTNQCRRGSPISTYRKPNEITSNNRIVECAKGDEEDEKKEVNI